MYDPLPQNRRSFFHRVSDGITGAALAYLLGRDVYDGSGLLAADAPPVKRPRAFDLSPKRPHFRPKAKAVIQLFMQGGAEPSRSV